MPLRMRACVIFNPTARGETARRFRERLGGCLVDCALRPTTAPGVGGELAAAAVEERFDTIIAAGGDGTIHEVINGMGTVAGAFERARLGILPLGTSNVFARELGLPLRLEEAWAVFEEGKERRVDVLRIAFSSSGAASHRYFVQLGGAGLDARAVQLVDWGLKKRIGLWAYIWAAWKAWREPHPRITARAAERQTEGELVLIGNGRFYGGSFPVFPNAHLDDGRFDVCVFGRITWPTLARYAFGFLLHRTPCGRLEEHFQAERLELCSAKAVPVELDGEFAGELPAVVTVVPGALRVLVPRG